jgi:hypothetical protein
MIALLRMFGIEGFELRVLLSGRPSEGLSNELSENRTRVEPHGAHEFDKFDDIQATLSPLAFRDKGLRLTDAFGEFGLRKSGALACSDHQGQKIFVGRAVDRAAHAGLLRLLKAALK